MTHCVIVAIVLPSCVMECGIFIRVSEDGNALKQTGVQPSLLMNLRRMHHK